MVVRLSGPTRQGFAKGSAGVQEEPDQRGEPAPLGLRLLASASCISCTRFQDLIKAESRSCSAMIVHRRALAIGNLQSRKLLERRLASKDKRRKILFLTKAGSELFETTSEMLIKMQNRILAHFPQDERDLFISLLQKLVSTFEVGNEENSLSQREIDP